MRKALPEISQMLSNWTVHGQNLGHMVDEYKRKSRTMPVKKRLQIGNFFNTASNVLDTIGSMTKNTILNSVQFIKGGLRGGSSIERTGSDMSNPPPIHLAPTSLNMTRYSARYEEDRDRNVIIPPETYSKWMYSGNFPVYPTGVQLRHNPNNENVDFAHDSDAGNTSEDDQSKTKTSGIRRVKVVQRWTATVVTFNKRRRPPARPRALLPLSRLDVDPPSPLGGCHVLMLTHETCSL